MQNYSARYGNDYLDPVPDESQSVDELWLGLFRIDLVWMGTSQEVEVGLLDCAQRGWIWDSNYVVEIAHNIRTRSELYMKITLFHKIWRYS